MAPKVRTLIIRVVCGNAVDGLHHYHQRYSENPQRKTNLWWVPTRSWDGGPRKDEPLLKKL